MNTVSPTQYIDLLGLLCLLLCLVILCFTPVHPWVSTICNCPGVCQWATRWRFDFDTRLIQRYVRPWTSVNAACEGGHIGDSYTSIRWVYRQLAYVRTIWIQKFNIPICSCKIPCQTFNNMINIAINSITLGHVHVNVTTLITAFESFQVQHTCRIHIARYNIVH